MGSGTDAHVEHGFADHRDEVMRDPLSTRKLLAKIDRDIDVYVCLDRFRQAFYDEADYTSSLETRIKLLEDAQRARVTETGVHKAIKAELSTRELNFSKLVFGGLAAGLGTLLIAAITWVASMAWKGLTK